MIDCNHVQKLCEAVELYCGSRVEKRVQFPWAPSSRKIWDEDDKMPECSLWENCAGRGDVMKNLAEKYY